MNSPEKYKCQQGSTAMAGGLSAVACGRSRVTVSAAPSLASPSAALQTVWRSPYDFSRKRVEVDCSQFHCGSGLASGTSLLVPYHIRRERNQKGFHVSAKAENAEPLDYPVTPAEAKPVYATLAALQLLLALPHFVSPEMAADIIFASTAYPLNVLQIPLHKLMGTGYLAAAIASWTLKGGAERMELHKPVYQRLNLGLITFSVALMAVMGGNIELLRPWALLVGTAECSAAATIPAWFYAATSGHSLQPITNFMKDVGRLLHITGFKSAAYSLLSVTFFGTAAAYLAAPEATLTGVLTYARSRDCILLWQAVGAPALMLPAWTFSLKEAADTRQLHAPAFKTLNLGLAFIGVAHVMTLMPWWTPCSSGPYMPFVIAAWGLAAATGTWGFLSSAPPAMEKIFERQQRRLGPGTYATLFEKQSFRHVDPDAEHSRVIVKDYPGAEGAYGAMAVLHMLFTYMHFLDPQQAADIVFTNAAQPIDPLQIPLHRVLATGYAAAAHTFWTLKAKTPAQALLLYKHEILHSMGGAARRELHLPAYQRLNLALMTFPAVLLGVHAYHITQVRPVVAAVAAAACGMTAAVPAYFYAMSLPQSFSATALLKKYARDVGDLVRIRNGASLVYSLHTLAFLGASAACLLVPDATLAEVFGNSRGPHELMLCRCIGSALLLLPYWTYNLKEGADLGWLRAVPFKTLNVGLLAIGLANWMLLLPWWIHHQQGPLMPYVLGTWATAAAMGAWALFPEYPTEPPVAP
ncbi:hypothetical protein COCOBI_04-1500 [Coccomyxa sp. Obi]|nr:hypothetical protein COCOBI_04-1500 [Coccomyxa sp. Obi]